MSRSVPTEQRPAPSLLHRHPPENSRRLASEPSRRTPARSLAADTGRRIKSPSSTSFPKKLHSRRPGTAGRLHQDEQPAARSTGFTFTDRIAPVRKSEIFRIPDRESVLLVPVELPA